MKATSVIGVKSKNRGFTLIEAVLYLALLSTLALGLVYFLIGVTQSRAKATAISEVSDNGRLALQSLSRVISSAKSINWSASVVDTHPGRLVLVDENNQQLTFSLDNLGVLKLTQNNVDKTITSNSVRVSNLVFVRFDDSSVGVKLGINYWPQANNDSYSYETNWQTGFYLPN
jgi:type II secretory pathway pseudopilin PulG